MESITIHKAKTQLSRLIEKACKGEEVVIVRGKSKEPVVKLVAVGRPKKRLSGRLKGKITYSADAFAPLSEKEMSDLGFE